MKQTAIERKRERDEDDSERQMIKTAKETEGESQMRQTE